ESVAPIPVLGNAPPDRPAALSPDRRTSSLSRNPCIERRGTHTLWIQFGNVKEGRMKDFHEWTKKNEGQFEKHAPPGWAYRGTFGAVLGFGNYDTALIMECSKYGDFDKLREHKDEVWDRLGQEASEFFLPGQGQAILLRTPA